MRTQTQTQTHIKRKHMLTIQNYKKILNQSFWTNSNTQEWGVTKVQELQDSYQILVIPKDSMTGIFVLSGAIVYGLQRESYNPDGYKMFNSKNIREAWVRRENLTIDNFLLELTIQTSLNTN